GACGYVGEGEHFPACRACSGSGGSAAGRQSRSSTYPRAFLVNLPRRAVAEALVLALLIVEIEPRANSGFGLGDRRIGVEVDFLVFEAAPQPLDKDVVHAATDGAIALRALADDYDRRIHAGAPAPPAQRGPSHGPWSGSLEFSGA